MDDNPIFKLIWRVNAIVILGVAIFGLLGAIVLLLELTRFNEPAPLVINEPTQEQPRDKNIRIGQWITGHNLIEVSIHTGWNNEYGLSKSGKASEYLNYGAYSPDALATNWAFPDNNQIITSNHTLSNAEILGNEREQIVVGYIMTVINNDSNADGGLSQKDESEIYYVSTDMSERIKLFSGVLGRASEHKIGPDAFLLTFKTVHGLQTAKFNSAERTITHRGEILPPP